MPRAVALWAALCLLRPHLIAATAGPNLRRDHDIQKPAAGRLISGFASVVDGDGLEINGMKIRLWGVDAPEVEQYCKRDDGTRWHCGQYATVALDALAGGRHVSCEQRELDAYGRALAVCKLNDRDLAGEQVRSGWALAYRKYSRRYVADETAAAARRLGMWASHFERPWDWRERMRAHERPFHPGAAAQGERR